MVNYTEPQILKKWQEQDHDFYSVILTVESESVELFYLLG